MKNILEKAQNLGKEIADSVKNKVEGLKSEKGFLVESFTSEYDLSERLNVLQDSFNYVDVQAACINDNGYIMAIIKLEEK